MNIFNVEKYKITRPKVCGECEKEVKAGENVYFGHTGKYWFLPKSEQFKVYYTCEKCAENNQGYIIQCKCHEDL